MVGDVTTGCVQPDECTTDAQCPDQYACALDPSTARRRCQDPCNFAFCTEKATCKTIQHKPYCSCPAGFNESRTFVSLFVVEAK
jgi:hypothetical protein